MTSTKYHLIAKPVWFASCANPRTMRTQVGSLTPDLQQKSGSGSSDGGNESGAPMK